MNINIFLFRWSTACHETVFRRWRNTTDNTVRLLWFCMSEASDCRLCR